MVENIFELLNSSTRGKPATSLQLEDGHVLYHQGDTCHYVYVVYSGYLKLTRLDNTGGVTITGLLDSGKVIGAGLSGADQANETASAKGSTQVLYYPNTTFNELIETCKPLAHWVINLLSERQNYTERRLQAVLNFDVRSRIALALHDLAKDAGGKCHHGHEVDIPLTQQELAEIVGASRPVVSSQLNLLKRQGYLDYMRGYICLNDLNALRAIADMEVSVS